MGDLHAVDRSTLKFVHHRRHQWSREAPCVGLLRFLTNGPQCEEIGSSSPGNFTTLRLIYFSILLEFELLHDIPIFLDEKFLTGTVLSADQDFDSNTSCNGGNVLRGTPQR